MHNIFFKRWTSIGCLPFARGWTYNLYQLGPPYLFFCFNYIVLFASFTCHFGRIFGLLYLSTLIVIKTLVYIFIFLVRGCPSLDFQHYSVYSWLFRQPTCPPLLLSAHLTANLLICSPWLCQWLMKLIYLALVNFLVFHSHFERYCVAHCWILTISF